MSLPGTKSLDYQANSRHRPRAYHCPVSEPRVLLHKIACGRHRICTHWACLRTRQQPQERDSLAACRGAVKVDKLLTEDAFTFMKNECASDKWVVVELTVRVRVSSIEILMLELYSSRVKDFDVYGSSSKATVATGATKPWSHDAWELLGRFQAVNKKGAQVGASAFVPPGTGVPRCWQSHQTCATVAVEAPAYKPWLQAASLSGTELWYVAWP